MATRKSPVLVVVQLTGGNDFMNTLIPYTRGIYHDSRPVVGIKAEDVLPLDDTFTWPVTIISDSEENLYVSDEFLHRIIAFNSEGEHIGTWGEHGTDAGQLNGPAGIAFDPEENLYVVDSLGHRVQKFTKDGKFLLG